MSRTRIKICGLTRPQDVRAAVESGADAIGFVFYPPSPRAVSVDQAAELAALLPPFVSSVGLFVNAAPPEQAEPLYERFTEALRARGIPTEAGIFGALMEVALVNDGPVTLVLER